MKTQMTTPTAATCSLHGVLAHAPSAMPGGYRQPSLPSMPKCSTPALAFIGSGCQGWFSNTRLA